MSRIRRRSLCSLSRRYLSSFFTLISLAFAYVPTGAHSADDASEAMNVAWLTGNAFERQLSAGIGFEWQSSPIRAGLARLAASQRTAVWLDRRVDPGFEVDLVVSDATLDEAFQHVARKLRGGISYVGPVVYIGPNHVTDRLATVAAMRHDDAGRLPSGARSRFVAQKAWDWEILAEPRQLLEELAREARATVENPDMIPHDLWPAANLPAMPLVDRMSLLLASFDLTFRFSRDGSAIELVPLPEEFAIERSYPWDNASRGSSITAVLAEVRRGVPRAKIERAGSRLVVVGTAEEQRSVKRLLSGGNRRPAASAEEQKRYDLRIENQPAGAVVKAVAAREKLEVEAAAIVRRRLETRISLDVKQVSLETLLEQTLEPVGLSYEIVEGALKLRLR